MWEEERAPLRLYSSVRSAARWKMVQSSGEEYRELAMVDFEKLVERGGGVEELKVDKS